MAAPVISFSRPISVQNGGGVKMDIKQREEIAAARKDFVLAIFIVATIALAHNMAFNDCINLGVC